MKKKRMDKKNTKNWKQPANDTTATEHKRPQHQPNSIPRNEREILKIRNRILSIFIVATCAHLTQTNETGKQESNMRSKSTGKRETSEREKEKERIHRSKNTKNKRETKAKMCTEEKTRRGEIVLLDDCASILAFQAKRMCVVCKSSNGRKRQNDDKMKLDNINTYSSHALASPSIDAHTHYEMQKMKNERTEAKRRERENRK